MASLLSHQRRARRLQLRATAAQEKLNRTAAARQGTTVTDFVLQSAREKAEQVLSEQTRFVLDEKQWEAFAATLDSPPKNKPRLRRLFTESHVAARRP